jgi:hypothetical protein
MKAEMYAKKFEQLMKTNKNQRINLLSICSDMIKEVNFLVEKKECKFASEVAQIFEVQRFKWLKFCKCLPKYAVDRQGFQKVVFGHAPQSYYIMIKNGFTPIVESKIKSQKEEQNGLQESSITK